MWKFTLINFIIGIAIAAIISMLLVLGLRIFLSEPKYPAYEDRANCATGDQGCYERANARYNDALKGYNALYNEFSGKVFVASNIAGLIILIIGLIIFGLGGGTNIAAGIIVSGAFGIIFGYAVGWSGADDKVKFVVGLIVAAIVIAGGIIVNRMRSKHLSQVSTV